MRFRRWYWWIVIVLLVHGIMLIYDFCYPDVYLHADRAAERWQTMQGLAAAWTDGSWQVFLATHGNAGDYLPQALLYQLGGRMGQIGAQVLLSLMSGWALMRIGLRLGLDENAAGVGACLYLLLPHTLVFPHQLASEAIFQPLLVLSLLLVVRGVAGGGGLLAGLANLVRPITLLWPLVVSASLAWGGQRRAALGQLLLALLPVLLWMGFIQAQSGHFGMGDSSRDMGHNLYQRTSRIAETMTAARQQQVRQQFLNQGSFGSLGALQYLRFAAQYPGPFLQHTARDFSVFCCKSGVERITIDYLEAGGPESHQLQHGSSWRIYLEQHGARATLQYLWRAQGAVLAVSLLGALAMVLLSAGSVLGAVTLLRRWQALERAQRMVAGLLIALPIYVLVFSQLVDAMQSRHRAPAEAAMLLLAVYGWRFRSRSFVAQ